MLKMGISGVDYFESFKEVYLRIFQVLFSNMVFIWISCITGFASLQMIFDKMDDGIMIFGTSLFIA